MTLSNETKIVRLKQSELVKCDYVIFTYDFTLHGFYITNNHYCLHVIIHVLDSPSHTFVVHSHNTFSFETHYKIAMYNAL